MCFPIRCQQNTLYDNYRTAPWLQTQKQYSHDVLYFTTDFLAKIIQTYDVPGDAASFETNYAGNAAKQCKNNCIFLYQTLQQLQGLEMTKM